MNTRIYQKGFTLVEILVAIAISGIIIIGLVRFYSTSQWSYSMQEQVSEMRQNGHYALRKLTEVLMEAGADLPDTSAISIIYKQTGKNDSITILANPNGGIQGIAAAYANVWQIPVNNGNGFVRANSILMRPLSLLSYDVWSNIWAIDTGKSTPSPWKRGIRITGGDTLDTIRFSAQRSVASGDTIFACNIDRYFLKGTNLCYVDSSNQIAENIDTLRILFYKDTSNLASGWADAKNVKLKVTARTSQPDRKYAQSPDRYRRLDLTTFFRLKNKM